MAENPLQGVKVYNAAGEEKTPEQIAAGKKFVVVYFGAHWVPPCRIFNTDMAKLCNSQAAQGHLAVIFVSYDGKPEAFNRHRAKLPQDWYHIKLEDESAIASISSALEADDLPHVAVLRSDNFSTVMTDARAVIQEDPEAAYEAMEKRAAE